MQEVRFHEEAEAELIEAALYYEDQSLGLGDIFLDAVDDAVRQIAAHPKSCPILRTGIRRKLASRFPYSILYELQPGRIRILAVAHNARRPGYWAHRS